MSTTQLRSKNRKRISEVFAVVAITLLITDTLNTVLPNILPLTDQQSGIFLGLTSIVLFFLSFGFAFNQRVQLTTSILIIGGLLLAVSKIIEPILGTNLYLAMALPYLYYSLIITGFVILGSGVVRAIRKQ
jgi:hypothetical protein